MTELGKDMLWSAEKQRHEGEYCKSTHSSGGDSRQGYLFVALALAPHAFAGPCAPSHPPPGPLEKQTIRPHLRLQHLLIPQRL